MQLSLIHISPIRRLKMEQTEIRKVRASIHQQWGNRVKIQQDLGRNKVDIQEGVVSYTHLDVYKRQVLLDLRMVQ